MAETIPNPSHPHLHPHPLLTSSDQVPNTQPSPLSPKYHKFQVSNSGAGNLILTEQDKETPTFYLQNTTFSFRKLTPSLTLYAGSSASSGMVLAVLQMGMIRAHTVGIGDPSSTSISPLVGGESLSGKYGESQVKEEVVWESLKKGGKWRSPWWEFEFGDVAVEGGGRRRYRWESEWELGFTRGRPGLVLREMKGGEGAGEVLARYEWMKGGKVNPWGVFELGRREGGDEGIADGDRDGTREEWSGFEKMVLITGLCVVVSKGSGI